MAATASYSLDQFLADTRATIKAKGIPSGLAEIRDHLEKLLRNPELLKKHLGDPVPYAERTTIGHDPETDVHVLVHGRAEGGNVLGARPRAVLGDLRQLQEPDPHAPLAPARRRQPAGPRRGSTLQREFLNEPGKAAVFAVGDIHSIEFGDDTFFIRVTGGDVETKETNRFDVAKQTVEVANRAMGQR